MAKKSALEFSERISIYVLEKHGLLLSEFKGLQMPVRVRCVKKHDFEIKPQDMLYRRRWCHRCKSIEFNSKNRWTVEELQRVADNFGGRCITKTYNNAHQKLEWMCRDNHVFKQTITKLKSTRRCPLCHKDNLQTAIYNKHKREIEAICQQRGGKCINIISPIKRGEKWRARVSCLENHEWTAGCHQLKNLSSWCQDCHIDAMVANRNHNRTLGLAPFNKIAQEHGGRCTSTSYINSLSKLKFVCAKGHRFQQRGSHVISGHWCAVCGSETGSRKKRTPIIEIKTRQKLVEELV